MAGANVVRGDDHRAGRCDPTGAARPRSRVARPRPPRHSLATDTLPRYGHVEECRAGLAIRRRTVWDHARDSGDSLAHRYSEAGTTCHCARPGLRHLTTGHTPLAHYPEAGGERDSASGRRSVARRRVAARHASPKPAGSLEVHLRAYALRRTTFAWLASQATHDWQA